MNQLEKVTLESLEKAKKLYSESEFQLIEKDSDFLKSNKFDEILLIGSGKGVTSVKTIKQIGWTRRKLKHYKIFSRHYRTAIKNCDLYRSVSAFAVSAMADCAAI